MDDPVLQSVPLGFQWPTIDPFLFCVHHDDAYPAGDGRLGPAAPLSGRSLGMDFEATDGWRMYHGLRVPGFPQHPHRGFETVTFVRQGLVDHSDSLGAAARYGRGDTQWLTAGRGIVHAEMFPLVETEAPNPAELFQIWMNLPAVDKMVEPHFTMLWADDQPTVALGDADVTVVAGELGGRRPPSPPPSSWASRPEADVAIWHVRLPAGGGCTLPPVAGPDTVRVLYLFAGSGLRVGASTYPASTGMVLDGRRPVSIVATTEAVECLVLQGRPIGEPVAQRGPFVMNTQAEIDQAFADYRRTGFGGWPWPADDPTNGDSRRRFARHADGHVEQPDTAAV